MVNISKLLNRIRSTNVLFYELLVGFKNPTVGSFNATKGLLDSVKTSTAKEKCHAEDSLVATRT
jgi:hypothetical protein